MSGCSIYSAIQELILLPSRTESPITDTSAALATEKAVVPGRLCRSMSRFFTEIVKPPVSWNRATYTALIALIVIWAVLMSLTWAAWGDLTIDCGREMYVPTVLSEGKMLYRDVWYPYPPAAPYLNSLLFRLFGIHLNVLYWAGSLSALGSAVFLYLIGMRLGSAVIGFTAGAVVLVQAFAAWLFSFPLPYTFASVYGCLTACAFLWFVIRACTSTRWLWIFCAGTAAAFASVLKTEYGTACYITLILLIAARSFQKRSGQPIWEDLLAILPGVLACLLVLRWMISIGGSEFLVQENLVPWPTSYFMRTYGKVWLENTGFVITTAAFIQAAIRLSVLGAFISVCYWFLRRTQSQNTLIFLAAEVSMIVLAVLVPHVPWQAEAVFRWICFPQDMVLVCVLTAIPAWWYFGRNADGNPALPLLFTFSSLLAFRLLMGMQSTGHAIYYNGPILLGFLLLVARLIVPGIRRSAAFTHQAEVLVCFNCLLAAAYYSNPFFSLEKDFIPLTTDRGTIRVMRHMAQNYQAAIAFMKEKTAAGESILSIPEDTSLYFLSNTHCPIRFIVFHPGVLVPGRMTDELIQDMERKRIRYLLWSNRTFPQYGAPTFGKDFDKTLANYLRTHYRPVRPLVPDNGPGWDAVIWERLPDGIQQ
jgi:hypothetical protein